MFLLCSGVLELNKDDFSSVEDIQDAIGAILGELADGQKSDDDITDICFEFMDILQMYSSNTFESLS